MKILDNASSNKTQAAYTVNASSEEIDHAKQSVLTSMAKTIKVDGFRKGNVPQEIVEKNVDAQALQSEIINHVINDLYSQSLTDKNLVPVGQPKITLTKFVPYSTLEFKVEVEIIANLKIADYKKFNLKLSTSSVTDKQLKEALDELQKRTASFTTVARASKNGDRLTIDFEGTDSKNKEKLDSATAKDHLLTLGTKTFIPGFEEKLVGTKNGQELTFDLTFPNTYFDQSFASRQVTFKVQVKSVEESKLEALDDKLAAKVGPFKTLDELKSQLKNELQRENDRLARQTLDNEILAKLAETTTCDIPKLVIDEEVESIKRYDQQTALNNSLTWKEFLKQQKLTEEQYNNQIKPAAEKRIKGGLALIEIAKLEGITVSKEELEEQLDLLKKQYTDPQMQAQLESDEVKNDLTKRILTQKVLDLIKSFN